MHFYNFLKIGAHCQILGTFPKWKLKSLHLALFGHITIWLSPSTSAPPLPLSCQPLTQPTYPPPLHSLSPLTTTTKPPLLCLRHHIIQILSRCWPHGHKHTHWTSLPSNLHLCPLLGHPSAPWPSNQLCTLHIQRPPPPISLCTSSPQSAPHHYSHHP